MTVLCLDELNADQMAELFGEPVAPPAFAGSNAALAVTQPQRPELHSAYVAAAERTPLGAAA